MRRVSATYNGCGDYANFAYDAVPCTARVAPGEFHGTKR